jgi:hypothetical protein
LVGVKILTAVTSFARSAIHTQTLSFRQGLGHLQRIVRHDQSALVEPLKSDLSESGLLWVLAEVDLAGC